MDNLKRTFLKNSKHLQISDSLYITLKEAIINNNLDHMKRLKEEEISKALDISRTPVREVLLLLQQNDFIVSDSAKGYIIKEYSIKECIDLINYVKILRRFSAGLVAKHITDSKLLLLKNIKLTKHIYQWYQEFHLKIAEYTDNKFMINEGKKTYEKLMLLYNYYTNDMNEDFSSSSYKEEYNKLLEAFKEHNSEKAEHIIDEYSQDLLLVIKRMYTLNFDISIHHISIYT